MTKVIDSVTSEEELWSMAAGYADSARRAAAEGKDTKQTMGRLRSVLRHIEDLQKTATATP